MDKKYQIFVSSTFRDLEKERAAIIEGILQMKHIPAGMELFLANDLSAWEYIRKVIEVSDYYVLVIGGRYGSVDDAGLSFTEKEYNYASSLSIPVIPLFHENPEGLPREKTDVDEAWSKLLAFRSRVEARHVRVLWDSPTTLKAQLIVSLHQQIIEKPGKGWIRDSMPTSTQMTVSASSDAEIGLSNSANDSSILDKPQDNWSKKDYESGLLHGIVMEDEAYIEAVSKAYLETIDANDKNQRIEWDARKEYMRIFINGQGSLAKLKEYATALPTHSQIQFWIGKSLNQYEEFRLASDRFLAATALTSNPTEKIRYLTEAIRCFVTLNEKNLAVALFDDIRALSAVGEKALVSTLEAERTFSDLIGENHAYIGATEKLLELDPTNIELRYDLAHRYAAIGKDELALLHYSRIPARERSSATWNNLGVALGRLKIEHLAVQALQKAVEAGETLANSNLALRFAEAGFLEEAKELCSSAKQQANFSLNIHATEERIRSIPLDDQKQCESFIEAAKPFSAFYRAFGAAIAIPPPNLQEGIWSMPGCKLNLSVDGAKFIAYGEYEVPLNALAFALFPEGKRVRNDVITIEGVIHGCTAIGSVKRAAKDAAPPSASALALGITANDTALFILSSDGKSIQVAENIEASTFRGYGLNLTSPEEYLT